MLSVSLGKFGLLAFLAIMIFGAPVSVVGQDSISFSSVAECPQKDLPDVIRVALHKPPKVKSESAGSLLIVPIIGSNPATGFIFGIGGQYAFKMKGSTLYSNFNGSAQYTTKNQMIFMLKNSIYTKNNGIFLTGDWRYLLYSQSTYGLGTTAPEGGILDYQYGLWGTETTDELAVSTHEVQFCEVPSVCLLQNY